MKQTQSMCGIWFSAVDEFRCQHETCMNKGGKR